MNTMAEWLHWWRAAFAQFFREGANFYYRFVTNKMKLPWWQWALYMMGMLVALALFLWWAFH